jgi:hypothetical protein
MGAVFLFRFHDIPEKPSKTQGAGRHELFVTFFLPRRFPRDRRNEPVVVGTKP